MIIVLTKKLNVSSCFPHHIILFSGKEIVVTKGIRSVEGLAIDWVSRIMFYADNMFDLIVAARIDNFDDKKVILKNLNNPRALVTNPKLG